MPIVNLSRTVAPLTNCVAGVGGVLNEIKAFIKLQNGFENLIRGSKVTLEEVLERAPFNWYIEVNKAVELGLVQAVV